MSLILGGWPNQTLPGLTKYRNWAVKEKLKVVLVVVVAAAVESLNAFENCI